MLSATLGCSIIPPLPIIVMRTHFLMGFWTLITNLILFFHYDFVLTLHHALMTSFLLFFSLYRKLLTLELWVLHQTTQTIRFPIYLQCIMESYLLQKKIKSRKTLFFYLKYATIPYHIPLCK